MTDTCSIDGCERTVRSRGWCNRHYVRWYRTGDPVGTTPRPSTPTHERFWAKVDNRGGDGCWLWTGKLTALGYGRLRSGKGDNARTVFAHRYAWEITTGVEPGELCILHLCDQPACVNPDHLALGSQAANIFDMVRKLRTKSGLTGDEIDRILDAGEPAAVVAAELGVAPHQVADIRAGRTFQHLRDEARSA